tara:strand:- start:131 stop:925 length:795 start_codon:yes stop_codon:yes gene_type:complete
MKKIIPIILLLSSFCYLQDEQPFPPLDLISTPTAGTLPKGIYTFETLLYGKGNILSEFLIGITNNFSIGFSFGLQGFIGNGDIKKNKSAPEINIKYRFYEENDKFPAVTIGFDTQGRGAYDNYNERYQQKAMGLYIVASRNWSALGNLGFHFGINKNIVESNDGDEDINLFFGIDKEINRSFSILAEYNFARNDDKLVDSDNQILLRDDKGFLNLGLKWSATDNIMLELNFNDNLKNIKYLNENSNTTFKSRNRELKVTYLEQF